jgi:hypothetical protein
VAGRDYREALRVAGAVGDREGMAIYTANVANLALIRGDWVGAETLTLKALSLAEEVGRQELIAVSCERLARALMYQAKGEAAVPDARRALEIFTKLGSPRARIARDTLSECAGDIES